MKAGLLTRLPSWAVVCIAALSAFSVYTCMYAFRKPFTTAAFEGNRFAGIDYKVWLIIAQTIGYTISKFVGISFIGGLKKESRARSVIVLIVIAWTALLFFGLFPAPYNIVFLLINGFPLGMIYGIVFSYLEGRRSTELLGAVLASSFIFASGFVQSAGKYIMIHWQVSEWWMPFLTGLLFFPPLIVFTGLLSAMPEPDSRDELLRTKRQPMSKSERRSFLKTFLPGLILLITAYVLLTIIRDYRSNFAADMWNELGFGKDASVFMRSEIPASVVVLVMMGLLVLVRNNIRALLINHAIIISGFALAAGSTLAYLAGLMPPFLWMTVSSVGLYMGYVPFNCMLFERLIAGFKYVSNAGFIIYVADSFGYLGSDVILLVKNLGRFDISWTQFFAGIVLVVSGLGIVLVTMSAFYFKRKHREPVKISIVKYV